MTATPVADQLASLRRLHGEMTRLDAEIGRIDETRAASRTRLAALNQRLAILRAGGAEPVAHDAELIAAIAADPTHAPDPDAVAAAIERQREARHGRDLKDAEASIVSDAIEAVEAEIAASDDRRSAMAARRNSVWFRIIKEGRVYLVDAFEAAFEKLAVDYLAPLHALAEMRDPDTGELVVRHLAYPRLSSDTLVKIERMGERADMAGNPTHSMSGKMHFPYHGHIKAKLPPAPLDTFFAAIGVQPPADQPDPA